MSRPWGGTGGAAFIGIVSNVAVTHPALETLVGSALVPILLPSHCFRLRFIVPRSLYGVLLLRTVAGSGGSSPNDKNRHSRAGMVQIPETREATKAGRPGCREDDATKADRTESSLIDVLWLALGACGLSRGPSRAAPVIAVVFIAVCLNMASCCRLGRSNDRIHHRIMRFLAHQVLYQTKETHIPYLINSQSWQQGTVTPSAARVLTAANCQHDHRQRSTCTSRELRSMWIR
jgi:hypothetical protein